MIESLIVVALILVLGMIALLNLGPRKNTKEFGATVEKIVHIFEKARNKAVNFEGGDKWVVVLRHPACPKSGPLPGKTAGLAIYFKTSSAAGIFEDFEALPKSVAFDPAATFDNPDGTCPSSKTIKFAGITGYASEDNGQPNLKIYLLSDPRVSSTISVSTLGLVTYTTSSLWNF